MLTLDSQYFPSNYEELPKDGAMLNCCKITRGNGIISQNLGMRCKIENLGNEFNLTAIKC